MKRKLISFLMLLFVTVFLTGCDLFGPQTTAATTEGTDTGTYYTVVFFDGDGTSILKTESVLEGQAATAPTQTPTKAATAQYSYVFTGWDTDFSNVTSDLLVNPTFNQTVNQYTVTFYDEDGTTVLGTDVVIYGGAATAPADPTKEDDETYSYEFAGWDVAFNNVTGNLAVTATYTASLLEAYTVTFENWDGTVLNTQEVPEGGDAVAPANPTRPQTAQYTFTFAGWDEDYTNVTADITITATYTQTVRQYTVTFANWDGTVLGTQSIAYGSGATAPANPTRPATAQYTYTFANWDVAFNNITADLTVTAQYTETVRNYTVTFANWDGTVITTESVAYGSGATAPANPTRPATVQYTYTFANWDVAFNNITGDLTVTAQYTETLNSYTVTFENEDGTVLDTQTIAYGSAATAPTDPSKAPTAQYTYTFAGWDVDFTNITGDLTVTATYTETVNTYTVTFRNEDGTELDSQTIAYGSAATAPANPTKPDSDMYTYVFAGWDVAFDNITGDLTVVATYTETLRTFIVKFVDDDGTEIDSQIIEYGSDAVAPANPYKAPDGSSAYEFAGWDVDFTNVMSELTVTATYNAVPLDTEYEVNFYDAYGNLMETQSIVIGNDAAAPMYPPVKGPDQQYTYTFAGWDVDFTNVNSNLDVYPVYTEVLNQYTVTFLDWDDTVLGTEVVDFGTGATAPADPTRPDDASWTYTFIGWDVPYNNVHMDIAVHAIYFKTSLLAFDHQQLVDLVNDMFGYPDDVEAQIDELLVVFETLDEETLYNQLLMAQQLIFELQFVNSADSLHNWYARVGTMGFDEDKLVSILFHAMTLGMTNDLSWIQQDIDYYLSVIADAEAQILASETARDQIYADASAYCLTTDYPALCQQYFDDLINKTNLEDNYYDALYGFNTPDEFNWNDYYNLEYYLEQVEYYSIRWIDPDQVIYYASLYNDYFNSLSVEEQQMYQPLLTAWDEFLVAKYSFEVADWSLLETEDGTGTPYIVVLDNYFYGYWDEFDNYHEGYYDHLSNISHYSWIIEETNWWLEDAYNELDRTQAMVNVLNDPQGAIDVMNLMHTVYDMLDAAIMTMDQEMFDFAFQLMDKLMGGEGPLPFRGREEYNPLEGLLTPENIVFVAGKLEAMLVAVQGTIDASDYANVQAVVIDFLDEFLTLQGMDPLDEAAFIANITLKMADYVTYVDFLGNQVISFLQSMDLAKAEAIISIVGTDFYMEGNEVDMVIKLTQIGTMIIGDGSIDIPTLFNYLSAVYFDVSTGFNADPVVVADYQTKIDTFIADTLLLANAIKDFNPTFMSPADVEDIFEFIARIKAIGSWFDMGFEHVDDPLVIYEDYYLYSFLHMVLGEWDIMNAVPKYLDVFGLTVEEDLFYTLTSIVQYLTGFTRVNDFNGIQEWIGGMETFGFTKAELVEYLVNLMQHEFDEAALGDDDFNWQLQNIDDMISYFQTYVDQWNAYMDGVDLAVQVFIDALDPTLQQDALDYWEAVKTAYINMTPYYDWYYEVEYYLGSSNALAIESALLDMYYYDPLSPEYASAEAAFLAIYDTLSPEYQSVVDEFEAVLAVYKPATWVQNSTYTVLFDSGLATAFLAEVDSQISVYLSHYNNWLYDSGQLLYWLQEREYLMEQLDFPIFLSEFFGDTANALLVENAIGILLDDLQNMVVAMPQDSFAILPRIVELIEQSMKPDIYYMEYEEEYVPFVIPFTAEEIHGLIQDISTFLKLRGDTITTEEMDSIESLITLFITSYVDTLELDPVAAADMVTMINDLVLKYADYLDLTLTEFTDLLDSITIEEVEMFLNVFNLMESGSLNEFQAVIIISQLISSLLDAPDFDLYSVLDMYLELYMEMNYGPENWDPLELAAMQDGWELFLTDTLTMIDAAALLDAMLPVDPLEYPALYEIQQRVNFIGNLFHYPEAILYPAYFGYTHDAFEELCYRIFDDVDWSNVDQRIIDLTTVFEMTEEETFYFILGMANTVYNLRDIRTVEDVRLLYTSLEAMGLDSETVAHYVMNAVMVFLYPNLLDMTDTSALEGQITYFTGAMASEQANYDAYVAAVFAQIELIADEGVRTDLYTLWYAYADMHYYGTLYDYIYDQYYWQDFFDWWTYNDLLYYFEMDDWDTIYWYLDGMSETEYWAYTDLLNLYGSWMEYTQIYNDQLDYFNSAHPGVTLFDNPYYLFVDYIDDQYNWVWNGLWMIHQYGQIIMNLEMEVAEIQENADLYLILNTYLSDPVNVALAEDVIVILLDEFEALLMNPDIIVLPEIIEFLPDGKFLDLSPEEIAMKLNRLGTLLNSMFSTIDAGDELVLENFANIVGGIVVEHFTDLTDPTEIAAQVAAVQLILATYGDNILDIPGLLGAFLITVDGPQVETIINELITIENIDTGDVDLDNIIRITSISNILYELTGDDTLNYALLVDAVLPFMYEMIQEIGYTSLTDDSGVVLLTTLSKIDLILAQADIVMLIDPYDLQPGDIDAINTMKTLVDDLGAYLDQIFNAEPPL